MGLGPNEQIIKEGAGMWQEGEEPRGRIFPCYSTPPTQLGGRRSLQEGEGREQPLHPTAEPGGL